MCSACLRVGGGGQDHDFGVSSSGHLGLPRTPRPTHRHRNALRAFGTEKKAVCCGQDDSQWVTGNRLSAPSRVPGGGAHTGSFGRPLLTQSPPARLGWHPSRRTAGPATETPRMALPGPTVRLSSSAAHHPGAPPRAWNGSWPSPTRPPREASSWFHIQPSYPHLPCSPSPASAPHPQGLLPPHGPSAPHQPLAV